MFIERPSTRTCTYLLQDPQQTLNYGLRIRYGMNKRFVIIYISVYRGFFIDSWLMIEYIRTRKIQIDMCSETRFSLLGHLVSLLNNCYLKKQFDQLNWCFTWYYMIPIEIVIKALNYVQRLFPKCHKSVKNYTFRAFSWKFPKFCAHDRTCFISSNNA